MERLERILAWGGVKRDVLFLVLSAAALGCSIAGVSPVPFDMAWVAIVLCGVPILLEAFIGLVTAFDIKADVLVSLALIASVVIGEDFGQVRWPLSCSWGLFWKTSPWRRPVRASRSWSA